MCGDSVYKVLAVQARCCMYVKGDRGDGGAVLAMAGVWQGSEWIDGNFLADRGDSDRMCAVSQRVWSSLGIIICEEASSRGREYLPVDVLTSGVKPRLAGPFPAPFQRPTSSFSHLRIFTVSKPS